MKLKNITNLDADFLQKFMKKSLKDQSTSNLLRFLSVLLTMKAFEISKYVNLNQFANNLIVANQFGLTSNHSTKTSMIETAMFRGLSGVSFIIGLPQNV